METENQKISFFSRVKIAIAQLENYHLFLSEKGKVAVQYFFLIVLLLAVVISTVETYDRMKMIDKGYQYIQNELPEFSYENGNLVFPERISAYDAEYDIYMIADTADEVTDEKLQEYRKEIKSIGLIFLKNQVIYKNGEFEIAYAYHNLGAQYEIMSLTKTQLIEKMQTIGKGTIAITIFLVYWISVYIIQIVSTFIDWLMMSVFALIVARVCRINMRWKHCFTISIYALTLSIILTMLYQVAYTVGGFYIEYFRIIYLLIAYVYIVAVILMIKSDLLKQEMEVAKIVKVQKEIQEQAKFPEEKEKEKEPEKPKPKDDKKPNSEGNTVEDEPKRFRDIKKGVYMKENKENKKNKIWLSFVSIIVLAIAIATMLFWQKVNQEEKELAYTELIQDINEGEIEKIKMTSGSTSVTVTYKTLNGQEGTEENEKDRQKKVIVPSIQAFIELVQTKVDEKGLEIELIQESASQFLKIAETLFSLLPTILLVALMLMIFKMQGFGGDKEKVYGGESNKKTDVRFKDIAGLDEEKGELIEIVDFLKKPQAYLDMGAKIPRGILLYGKPGTGKTLIAKAIAGEAGVPFISMSGSEFIEMFAGLGASRVRKLFDKAKKMSPAIIFIDEIDAIGARRTSNSGAETENNQTLNQLLVEMDGFETDETVIVLAATNRPEMLDKALLRPGRFDRQITIPTPDLNGREAILKLHSANKKFADDVDFRSIAGDTAGFTGAELANILNEAAIIATRENHNAITNTDVENAVKKVTVGLEKANRVISDKDKKLTAYHEAGHAVVSKFLETQTDVKEVSIIPRGAAGGYTMYKTNEDKYYISKTELLEKMVALMGGRAAEKIALNEISTGASNDIEVATGIAKDMLTVYGMDDKLGPISLKVGDPYELQIFGEKVIDEVGNQIQILIENAYVTAQRILRENMDILDRVALCLLEKEKISSEEFEKFFE